MANTLILDKPFVFNGLGTLTYTVATTGNYNVKVQTTVPAAPLEGFGAGSGADQGLGATGGFPGAQSILQSNSNGQTGLGTNFPTPIPLATTTPNLPSTALGSGNTGLGSGGSENDNATGNGSGHGAGAGGGDEAGFARGGLGTSDGGVGQGFGPSVSGYGQPPVNVVTPTTFPAISSGVTIVVNQNGSPVFTAPTIGQSQSAQQFKFSLQCTATDVITVVLSSSTASDEQLSGVQSNVSIGTGF